MNEDICHIEKAESIETLLSPILINFDYGHHPEKESARIECDLYVEPEDHSKRKLFVTRNGQTFTGKLPPEEKSICQTMFLIRNRKTNKARIIPVQSCNLINLAKEEENIKRKRHISSVSTLNKNQKLSTVDFLKQNFGSKKSKRVSEMGLRINVDLSGKETEIKETVSSIDVKLNEISTINDGNEELLKLIPPCKRDAAITKDVYDINDIITATERETLRPQAEFLINNGLTNKDEKSSFFMFTYYTLIEDDPDIDKVILLLYANTLYKFYNLSAGDLKSKNLFSLIHPTSRPVSMRVLADFTVLTKTGRTRSSFYKDKLVCYLMVIILLFADFKINLDTLSSCLKGFDYKKLLQLARVVGVLPVNSFSSAKVFTLKVPLPPLPRPRIPKKRATTSF